ncbi:hypothetical protein KIPB_010622 [Kipferlia bialata]|uniref:Uncharacterized protein n=1 Tax=Kipferlia bialata TaxID=797122 RepID=A0A9K3D4C0_9EUKA|nr:hypothetical protein KIPB_010622 [Kipferlia bialata]|eukprot:g10622.t1
MQQKKMQQDKKWHERERERESERDYMHTPVHRSSLSVSRYLPQSLSLSSELSGNRYSPHLSHFSHSPSPLLREGQVERGRDRRLSDPSQLGLSVSRDGEVSMSPRYSRVTPRHHLRTPTHRPVSMSPSPSLSLSLTESLSAWWMHPLSLSLSCSMGGARDGSMGRERQDHSGMRVETMRDNSPEEIEEILANPQYQGVIERQEKEEKRRAEQNQTMSMHDHHDSAMMALIECILLYIVSYRLTNSGLDSTSPSSSPSASPSVGSFGTAYPVPPSLSTRGPPAPSLGDMQGRPTQMAVGRNKRGIYVARETGCDVCLMSGASLSGSRDTGRGPITQERHHRRKRQDPAVVVLESLLSTLGPTLSLAGGGIRGAGSEAQGEGTREGVLTLASLGYVLHALQGELPPLLQQRERDMVARSIRRGDCSSDGGIRLNVFSVLTDAVAIMRNLPTITRALWQSRATLLKEVGGGTGDGCWSCSAPEGGSYPQPRSVNGDEYTQFNGGVGSSLTSLETDSLFADSLRAHPTPVGMGATMGGYGEEPTEDASLGANPHIPCNSRTHRMLGEVERCLWYCSGDATSSPGVFKSFRPPQPLLCTVPILLEARTRLSDLSYEYQYQYQYQYNGDAVDDDASFARDCTPPPAKG